MKPWEKRKGESARAYQAFLAYRDMGQDRGLLAAYRLWTGRQQARTIPGYWKDWSVKYEWPFRSDHWDAELIRLADHELRRRVGVKASQYGALIEGLFAAAATELRRRITMLARENLDERAISSLGSIAQAIDIGMKHDRLVTGEAQEKLEHAGILGRVLDPRQSREELVRRLEGIAMHDAALEALRAGPSSAAPAEVKSETEK